MLYGVNHIVMKSASGCIVWALSLVLLNNGIAFGNGAELRGKRVSSKTLRSMARIYMAYGEYTKAQPFAEKAVEFAEKTKEPHANCTIPLSPLYPSNCCRRCLP